jgi:hypothetical protein
MLLRLRQMLRPLALTLGADERDLPIPMALPRRLQLRPLLFPHYFFPSEWINGFQCYCKHCRKEKEEKKIVSRFVRTFHLPCGHSKASRVTMCSMMHSTCVLLLWKTTHPLRSDPVVGGARKFQRGAVTWQATRRVFSATPHPAVSINQSIDCPYTSSFNFYLDATHLAGVSGFREDWVRKKRPRCVIETLV